MKKFLFLLILAIACISCVRHSNYQDSKTEDATYGWNFLDTYYKYRVATIDGHQYLIFAYDGPSYGRPMCVIHSESCPCKNKKR